jgi:hypothetical protein
MKPDIRKVENIKNAKMVRRDFLKLSSATVAAPALAASVVTVKPFPKLGFAGTVAAEAPHVSIGYWDGRLASSFVDARQLASSDEQLASGVNIRVVGCCGDGDLSVWEGFRSVSLGFSLQPFHDGDLRAWHYQSSPVVNTSALASFSLPIDAATGLSGWIEYRDLDSRLAPTRVPFRLGLDGTSGTAKLRSGYYVIAMRSPGSLIGMDWESLRLRVVDGGNAISLKTQAGRHIDQPHIVLEIDAV